MLPHGGSILVRAPARVGALRSERVQLRGRNRTVVAVIVDGAVVVRPDLTAVGLVESCRIGGSHRIANEDLGVGTVGSKPTGTIAVPRRALNVEYDQRSTALCREAAAAAEVRHAIGYTGKDRPGSAP